MSVEATPSSPVGAGRPGLLTFRLSTMMFLQWAMFGLWAPLASMFLLAKVDEFGGLTPMEEIAAVSDPRRREWLLGLAGDEFKRHYEEGILGLAMADLNEVKESLSTFQLRRMHRTDTEAAVTIVSGTREIDFRMVKVNGEWYFAVDRVEIR